MLERDIGSVCDLGRNWLRDKKGISASLNMKGKEVGLIWACMSISEWREIPKQLSASDSFASPCPFFQSAPFCVKCGIVKPYRVLILICSFTGSALLWWALNLSTWVKIENSHQSFFSALFAICSGEIKCWALPSKSSKFWP